MRFSRMQEQRENKFFEALNEEKDDFFISLYKIMRLFIRITREDETWLQK